MVMQVVPLRPPGLAPAEPPLRLLRPLLRLLRPLRRLLQPLLRSLRPLLRLLQPLLRLRRWRVAANCARLSVLQEPGGSVRRALSLGADDADSAPLAGGLDEEGGLVDGARAVSAKGRESQAWRGQAMKLTAEPSWSSEFRSLVRSSPGVMTWSHRLGGRVVEST